MSLRFVLNAPTQPASPLRKLAAWVVVFGVFALVLMFSAVLLVVLLVIGVIAGIYIWWKTRELRRVMRMMQSVATPDARRDAHASNDGVFEGEVIREVDPKGGR